MQQQVVKDYEKKKPCRAVAKRVLGALPKGSISAALDVDILKGYTSLPKGSIYQILVKRFWLFLKVLLAKMA